MPLSVCPESLWARSPDMVADTLLPPPGSVSSILVWHQGGLGDLLLAGPALTALCRRYPEARLVGVGHPGRWGLLADTLPVAAVWDGGEALWSGLFLEGGPMASSLRARLAGVDVAVVFSPRRRPSFLRRLGQAGARQTVWLPSFPEGGTDHVVTVQARRLAELGLTETLAPWRLRLEEADGNPGPASVEGSILALAPGSGSPAKNWPLSHYYEVGRTLAWEKGGRVVWLAGPAEAAILPYLQGLAAAQGQEVWQGESLREVARLLSRTRLYLGGDSGLSHLAAAAGAQRVVALFGPSDPRVWAPLGPQVTVLTPPGGAGPEASLAALSPVAVLAALRRLW